MSEAMLNVSASPHVRAKVRTCHIMQMVIVALLPAAGYGIFHFGYRAALHILLTVAAAVIAEYLFEYFMHRPITTGDCSAVVTGLLLALNLPVAAPLWIGPLGSVFAIIVVKQLFGGLGQNFMNPALGARCFLLLSFAGHMTNFTYDTYSAATPLATLKETGEVLDLQAMITGNVAGTIGETSVIAILIGAVFLILMGVIDFRIPGSYLLSFAAFICVFGGRGFDVTYLSAQLAGGGLMLGAWFMATDYVTAPITKGGQYIYGVLLGILTGLFRLFGPSAEGVSYAIILGNLLVPLIEKITVPRPFGWEGKRK